MPHPAYHDDLATARRVGLFDATRSAWKLIVVGVLGSAVIGLLVSLAMPIQYRSSTTLYLQDPSDEGVFGSAPSLGSRTTRVYTEARQATSPQTLDRATRELEGDFETVDNLERQVDATPIADLSAVRITATASTPERAQAYARSVSIAYRETAAKERRRQAAVAVTQLEDYQAALRGQLTAIAGQIADLQEAAAAGDGGAETDATLESLREQRAALSVESLTVSRTRQQVLVDTEIAASSVYRIEPPQLPKAPSRPRRQLNMAVAALLGLMGSLAAAVWHVERRGAVDDPDEPATLLGAPLLGVLPDLSLRPTVTVGDAGATATWDPEMSRALQLLSLALDRAMMRPEGMPAPVVLVTGTGAQDRRAELVVALGLLAALADRRVALVDGDVDDRRLSILAHDTVGDVGWREDLVPMGLHRVGHPGEDRFSYLSSHAFRRALDEIRMDYDLVFLVVPDQPDAPTTQAMARTSDAVVLCVTTGTPIDDLRTLRTSVQSTPMPLVGCVFDQKAEPRRGRLRWRGDHAPSSTWTGLDFTAPTVSSRGTSGRSST